MKAPWPLVARPVVGLPRPFALLSTASQSFPDAWKPKGPYDTCLPPAALPQATAQLDPAARCLLLSWLLLAEPISLQGYVAWETTDL